MMVLAQITTLFVSELFAVIGVAIMLILVVDLYKYNRTSKGWLAIVAYVAIGLVRTSYVFASDFGYFSEISNMLRTYDSIFLLMINVLQIVGFWAILKGFEAFDIMEKKVKDKVKSFGKIRKKR